jgi:hypothetical protein
LVSKIISKSRSKTAAEKENKEIDTLSEQIIYTVSWYFQGKFDIKNTSKSKDCFLDFL